MSGNLTAAAIFLLIGAIYVYSRRTATGGKQTRNWIPLTALIAGPAIALAWWAADSFVFNRANYLIEEDAWALLPPILVIGVFVGLVSSGVFGVVLRFRRRDRG